MEWSSAGHVLLCLCRKGSFWIMGFCVAKSSEVFWIIVQSSDPVASKAGHRFDTAALLHNHVYVGFHDLRDLSHLETKSFTGDEGTQRGLRVHLWRTAFCTFNEYQPNETQMRYLRRFKEHLSLIHGDLVGAGLRGSKENDVLVRKSLQRFGLASLVHWYIFSTHTQPQIMRESSFFALWRHKHGNSWMASIVRCGLAAELIYWLSDRKYITQVL